MLTFPCFCFHLSSKGLCIWEYWYSKQIESIMLKLDHTTIVGQKLPFNKKIIILPVLINTYIICCCLWQTKANLTPAACVAESRMSLVSLAASSPGNDSAWGLHNIHVSYRFLISGLFYFWDFFSIGRLNESSKRWVNLHNHCCIRIFLSCAECGTFFHRPWLKSMSIWFVRSWKKVDYILPFLLQEKQNCNKVCTTCAAIKEQDS